MRRRWLMTCDSQLVAVFEPHLFYIVQVQLLVDVIVEAIVQVQLLVGIISSDVALEGLGPLLLGAAAATGADGRPLSLRAARSSYSLRGSREI